MSESTEAKEKIQRCIISNLSYDPKLHTISCDAELAGKLQKGTEKTGVEWSIDVIRTKLTVNAVPLRDILIRCFVGWFWVRCIQDALRKGTKAEAIAAMKMGYDWTEATTTKKAEKAAPAIVAQRATNAMTEDERAAFIKMMTEMYNPDGTVKNVG